MPEELAIAEVVTAAGMRLIPCFVDERYLVDADFTAGDSADHVMLATLALVSGQAGNLLNWDIDVVRIRDAGAAELILNAGQAELHIRELLEQRACHIAFAFFLAVQHGV